MDGQKDTTAENARAFANARRSLTTRTFGSLDGTVTLQNRYDRSPGEALKQNDLVLMAGLGLSL